MKIIIGAIAILVVAVLAVFLTKNDKTPTTNTNNTANDQSTSQTEQSQTTDEVTTKNGTYVSYTAEALSSATGTRLLFFHAPWCPQCRALDESIKQSEIPADVTIFKVDYDSNQSLRKQYGVTIQTTVVRIDNQGNLVEKYVAYDQPNFESVKSNLL